MIQSRHSLASPLLNFSLVASHTPCQSDLWAGSAACPSPPIARGYRKHPELLKLSALNVGIGHAAAADDSKLEAVRTAHTQLFESVEEFFATHDMLVTPTVIVQPNNIDL